MVQSNLLKWTRRTLKRIQICLVLFWECGRNIPVEKQHLRNVTDCNNKFSLHFKKTSTSSKVWKTYSEIYSFFLTQ